ncbi:M56 family metallopeptidase [Tenacibaculum amylolyticum]|uniref:M56 family metallopeptidase n=1 Tax=Tenacibaculum amylolyticum TaxID=104269 RepID=UPI0038962A48
MLTYIIQVILFQVLFLGIYDLFLSKETFFSKNRFYLLITIILSFVLPLIKIPTIQKVVTEEYNIILPEIVLSPQTVIEQQKWYQSINYLDVLFWIGASFFVAILLYKLVKIFSIVYKNKVTRFSDYNLVSLPNSTKAFSFFNYIFLGDKIEEKQREKIITHELVHSKQKHTLDLLFFEFLKVVMWFNPMIWVFQKRISLVHEFLSDAVASKTTEKNTYINSLLSEAFQVEQIAFINQFYKSSLLKKRIIMMTKKQSKKVQQLKYLLLVPVLASMLLYTACSENEPSINQQEKVSEGKNPPPPPIFKAKGSVDVLYGKEVPTTREYSFDELSEQEQKDFSKIKSTFKVVGDTFKLRIFEGENDRKVVFIDMKEIIKKTKKAYAEEGLVPFSVLDNPPAFIGKGTGKDSFNRNMADFVQDNFDSKIANTLGLEPGKKRIYAQFRIDKEGNVVNIKVRAPHPKLKEHVKEMIEKLPQMTPGEKDGKIVKVGYVLPITFEVN